MTDQWSEYRDLTKWPRLLVQGDPVDKELAAEIIIRTWDGSPWSNDKAVSRRLIEVMGEQPDKYGDLSYEALERFLMDYKVVDLNYLHNNRVVSSWIGGPHGWIDWSGEVGCSTYNIGKYPSPGDVYTDWVAIARVWPQLRLTAQLVADEGEGTPIIQYNVSGGRVTHRVPLKPLRPCGEVPMSSVPRREQGVGEGAGVWY